MYGAWFSILGVVITLAVNVAFVPRYGYMASAWASFACYSVMMLVSYFFGQKYMPIRYDLKSMGLYLVLTLALFGASFLVQTDSMPVNLAYRTALLAVFIVVLIKRDFPLSALLRRKHP